MTTTQPPKFSFPELQKAVDSARPFLEGADQAMTQVSNDIKVLEAYLHGLKLKQEYRLATGKTFAAADGANHEVAASLEMSGSATGFVEEEALVWGKLKNGEFRLLHEVSRWEGSIDVDCPGGPMFWDEKTVNREVKPLIETAFEVRKRLFQQHVVDFVNSLAAQHRIDKPTSSQERMAKFVSELKELETKSARSDANKNAARIKVE